ncbi:MAG: transglycosylase SLT domain-containing protein [Gammaproteobacteria bacterium]|jgi:hypothetical protein
MNIPSFSRNIRDYVCRWQSPAFNKDSLLLLVSLLSGLGGCASQPANITDTCELLNEEIRWYDYARHTSNKWNVDIGTQLAFMRQESAFNEDAQPPRTTILWIIPWKRPTSAYGFAQAVDGTWEWYQEDTGNTDAERDDFADASDFIGWYINKSSMKLGIARNDVVSQYLAYHEGHGGFESKSYQQKKGLMSTAQKVAKNADKYNRRLAQCESDLQHQAWWWLY